MKPTDILKEEHRGIEVMLSVLEQLCLKLQANEQINPEHVDQTIDFFKGFADTCHHRKEEHLLFPAMETAGFSKEAGPIAVMLDEHRLGRTYVATMSEAFSAMKRGIMAASPAFVKAAREYISLLSDHIAKEDNILFPMAEHHLSSDVQSGLANDFERAEQEEVGTGRHEEYHNIMKKLKGIYLT